MIEEISINEASRSGEDGGELIGEELALTLSLETEDAVIDELGTAELRSRRSDFGRVVVARSIISPSPLMPSVTTVSGFLKVFLGRVARGDATSLINKGGDLKFPAVSLLWLISRTGACLGILNPVFAVA